MFESIIKFFNKLRKKEEKVTSNSKETAKERLHLVLMQDRANVSADFLELMKQEIIEVIKKYIDIDEGAIDVRLTNKENEDGTNGAPALYANIPIINIKNEARKVEKQENKDESPKIENQEDKDKLQQIEKQEDKEESQKVEKQEDRDKPKEFVQTEEKANEEIKDTYQKEKKENEKEDKQEKVEFRRQENEIEKKFNYKNQKQYVPNKGIGQERKYEKEKFKKENIDLKEKSKVAEVQIPKKN